MYDVQKYTFRSNDYAVFWDFDPKNEFDLL